MTTGLCPDDNIGAFFLVASIPESGRRCESRVEPTRPFCELKIIDSFKTCTVIFSFTVSLPENTDAVGIGIFDGASVLYLANRANLTRFDQIPNY